jgi:stage III sporulation protein AE
LVRDAISGQIDLSMNGIISSFGEIIFAEFLANGQLIRQLIIIAILGALMSCLTEAFKHKSAGETGFYVTYLMAVLLAISSFYLSAEILNSLVSLVDAIMTAAIPLMIGLMAMGGNFVGAAGTHSLLFFAMQLISRFISVIFVPLVLSSAALDIAGQISPDGHKLEKMAELLRKIAGWSLKGILAAFAFLLTLQRFSAPIISNAAIRTSRSVVGAVPVVGNAFTAAVDTVVTFSQAARSGVLVALVLVLCAVLAAPLLKMLALSLIYRATAAFLQPVADKRLVTLMDAVGKHMSMLFNAAAMVGVVCVYAVVVLLSF